MSENKKDIARLVKPHIKSPRNGKAFNDTILKLDNLHRSLKTKKGKKHLQEQVLKYYLKYAGRHRKREPLDLNKLEGGCLCSYIKFAKLEGGFLNPRKIVAGIQSARRLYQGMKQLTRDHPWTLTLADQVYSYAMDTVPGLQENVQKVTRLYNIMKDFTEQNQWTLTLAEAVLAYVLGNATKDAVFGSDTTQEDVKDTEQPKITEDTDVKDLADDIGDDNDFDLDDGEINDLMRKLLSVEVQGNIEKPTFRGRKKIKVAKRF